MSHVTHLNKSGSGMASKTACGRNVLRSPLATNWDGFKAIPVEQRCEKCEASKQAALNAKGDAKKAAASLETELAAGEWIAEDPAVTMARDDALIAARRAKTEPEKIMSTYTVTANVITIGEYMAATAQDARDQAARDAGYKSEADMEAQLEAPSELVAKLA